jgi:hypothetical protein
MIKLIAGKRSAGIFTVNSIAQKYKVFLCYRCNCYNKWKKSFLRKYRIVSQMNLAFINILMKRVIYYMLARLKIFVKGLAPIFYPIINIRLRPLNWFRK